MYEIWKVNRNHDETLLKSNWNLARAIAAAELETNPCWRIIVVKDETDEIVWEG